MLPLELESDAAAVYAWFQAQRLPAACNLDELEGLSALDLSKLIDKGRLLAILTDRLGLRTAKAEVLRLDLSRALQRSEVYHDARSTLSVQSAASVAEPECSTQLQRGGSWCTNVNLKEAPDEGRTRTFHSKRSFIKRHISPKELKHFFMNLADVTLVVSMALALVVTWAALEYEWYWNAQVAIAISPIVFPLAFSINESYRRREKALNDFCSLFAASTELYWLHREWSKPKYSHRLHAVHASDVKYRIEKIVETLLDYVKVYHDPDHTVQQQKRSKAYQYFSKLADANDTMRQSRGGPLGDNSPLITRLVHYHEIMLGAFERSHCNLLPVSFEAVNAMQHMGAQLAPSDVMLLFPNDCSGAFERIRLVRDYRTPRTVRGFCKIVVFCLPTVLAPWYAFMARKGAMDLHPYQHRHYLVYNATPLDDASQHWSAYVIVWFFFALLLVSLSAASRSPFHTHTHTSTHTAHTRTPPHPPFFVLVV